MRRDCAGLSSLRVRPYASAGRGVDERVAKIRTHDGREIEAPLKRLRHIDGGEYAVARESAVPTAEGEIEATIAPRS